LKLVPGTKCSQKIFQKFFRSKNKVFGLVKIPKKTFFVFEFFPSISWGLCTGTKSEKLKFYSSNILNSSLVTVLNPKSTTVSPLVPVQRPQIYEKKIQKKFFLCICTGPNTLFLDLKNFLKIFWLHLVLGTTFKQKNLKNSGSTRY
jgi:hypothetical protein